MEKVISIHQPRVFTLKQAEELLPLIYRMTEDAQSSLKKLIHQRDTIRKNSNNSTTVDLEEKIRLEIEAWERKVKKLGVHPKGVWLVDFDNGTGHYCWKFPETEIHFCHGYNEGFTGRRPVAEN